jgi:Flp pilus assembly protein TadD
MRQAWAVFLIFTAGAAIAAPAPKAPPKSQIDRWFDDLAKAGSPEDAKPIEDKIANAFRQSGSPSVDLLMSRAKAAMTSADNKTAAAILAAVTKAAPQYAEGWHVRATLDAASGNDSAAMIALQQAISINPRNFPVMIELAGMLEDYGDKKAALGLYRKALALDPQLDVAARRVRALEKDVEGQGI